MAASTSGAVPDSPLRVRLWTWSAVVLTFLSLALLAFLSAVLGNRWAWDVLLPLWALTVLTWGVAAGVRASWRHGSR
jgi:hypothetical protein